MQILKHWHIFALSFQHERRCKYTKNMRKEILVPYGCVRKLARDLGYSEVTIRSALKGRTHSLTSMKIRKAALENGGVMMEG